MENILCYTWVSHSKFLWYSMEIHHSLKQVFKTDLMIHALEVPVFLFDLKGLSERYRWNEHIYIQSGEMDPSRDYYYDLNSFHKIRRKFHLHTHNSYAHGNLEAKFKFLVLYWAKHIKRLVLVRTAGSFIKLKRKCWRQERGKCTFLFLFCISSQDRNSSWSQALAYYWFWKR